MCGKNLVAYEVGNVKLYYLVVETFIKSLKEICRKLLIVIMDFFLKEVFLS